MGLFVEYTAAFRYIASRYVEERERIRDDWLDEASEAAVQGNPAKAGHIEYVASRLNDPMFGEPIRA